MDWGSLAGLLLALGGIIIGQRIEGGNIASLLQPTAFIMPEAFFKVSILLNA